MTERYEEKTLLHKFDRDVKLPPGLPELAHTKLAREHELKHIYDSSPVKFRNSAKKKLLK